jgi:acyl-coenzyme A synthetase/AMP-(fatty) acid ligase
VDDVINGRAPAVPEIESACPTVPEIAEATVVPVVDEIKAGCRSLYFD